ncbi:MAG: hypothetical protein FD166_2940 [Bacteroidetes bacterium]|nr:MAG: hypothetical protein FD166_2940 [Bacteroidota bacterium]
MNSALTTPGHIEYFEANGICYALDCGIVHPVIPGSKHYLKALEAAISHPDFRKIKAIYKGGNALVYGFIHDYMGGWNERPDLTCNRLTDTDGARSQMINDVRLTPREVDIVKGIASGLADKQVADRLHIATNTVITILKNIRAKTGCTSKYHIVSMAAKSGVI